MTLDVWRGKDLKVVTRVVNETVRASFVIILTVAYLAYFVPA